jgi:AbrB family looped-hinge helix DNA binding protein
MPSAMVTSKGQITIPKRIRDFLQVKPGDRIDFDIDASGKVDFADYLVGWRNRQAGGAHTTTFDQALRRNRLFRVL